MVVLLRGRQILSMLAMLSVSIVTHADECQQAGVQEVRVDVDTTQVRRLNAPKELFGFNVPWRDFQLGYFRNGTVRPELIEWLTPFKGASYRYPGGSPSNWFEWRKSVGPLSQRAPVHADFDRYAVPEFGLGEFADFVTTVKGRALMTLNISGPFKEAASPDAVASDAVELLNYVQKNTRFGCVGGENCGVMAFELGNEIDWAPYSWPVSVYVSRANAIVSAVSATMPEVQWVANGRTAPWDAKSANYNDYNTALANSLAGRIHAIAIHPYYDGISIPAAVKYVSDFGKSWAAAHAGGRVYVTEHARWPSQPLVGPWESNWYQATGLGGALASADFLLAIMGNPQVAEANWHALGVEGPWQLVRWNRALDQLYPSPVYWGLRTIREAYLDHVVKTQFSQPSGVSYSGGYDLRLVGMVSADGKTASVLGINRGARPYQLRLTWTSVPRKAGSGMLRTLSGGSTADDNTDLEPQKLVMQTISRSLRGARTTSTWCVPANSVFSVTEP